MRRIAELLHHNFLSCLVISYLFAAVLPGPGLSLRGLTFGSMTVLGEKIAIVFPMVQLALLLFNAGLGVKTAELNRLFKRPSLLGFSLVANFLVPIAFIFVASVPLRFWHNPLESQSILLGLALVASMPIAGSSSSWSQNANGDMALSLGLILLSTVLSPFITPAALRVLGVALDTHHASALWGLADHGAGSFLFVCVLVPSLAGIAAKLAVGERRIERFKSTIKIANSTNLLLLCYSNAALSLPAVLASPDPDFMALTFVVLVLMIITAFAAGWFLPKLFRADSSERTSVTFGLGMNNNGTGLVLAGIALADFPLAMVPIIFYNLLQHLAAGAADRLIGRWRKSRDHQETVSAL